MREPETILLTRDCEVIQIPSGDKMLLPREAKVMIHQALGGSYTVITDQGYMVRIDPQNADAIGKPIEKAQLIDADGKPKTIEQLVWDQLKTCYDPEIPVDIVELGLVYVCDVRSLPDGTYSAYIQMTLTAPGCGMGPVLKNDVETKVTQVPGIASVHVDVVFEPPWDQSRMSDVAKLQLGWI